MESEIIRLEQMEAREQVFLELFEHGELNSVSKEWAIENILGFMPEDKQILMKKYYNKILKVKDWLRLIRKKNK